MRIFQWLRKSCNKILFSKGQHFALWVAVRQGIEGQIKAVKYNKKQGWIQDKCFLN